MAADFTAQVWGGERIYMVGFGRAKTGDPHMDYPDVDDIGFTDDAHAAEHGPIVNAVTGDPAVKVRFHRVEISNSAKLYLVSTDPTVARITHPAGGLLSNDRSQNFTFASGNAAGRAAIEVRYNYTDGPVIGRLYVQVNLRVNVLLRLHLVTTVAGNGHTNPFLGVTATTSADRHAAMKKLFRSINHIWVPHGVFLQVEDTMYDKAWTAAALGTAVYPPPDANLNQAGATDPDRSALRVNVFFIPVFSSAATVAFATSVNWAKTTLSYFPAGAPAATRHLANHVMVRTSGLADTHAVAHELGHYFNLCAIDGARPWAYHSCADTKVANDNQKIRDDSVTRRRIMYPYVGLPQMATKTYRNNVGYGNLKPGDLVSSRRLSQDVTLDEVARATAVISNGANLYAP
jgi:hypothetical protein